MPLLIQSLQLEEQPELWLSSLSTLYDLMHDTPDTFHTHVSDLVPTLLTLAKYPHKMVSRLSIPYTFKAVCPGYVLLSITAIMCYK